MSQAFVKEGDASDDLPERPISERPNYVTAEGLAALRSRHEELSKRLAELKTKKGWESDPGVKVIERDLRYLEARNSSAILVKRSGDKPNEVRFGTTVELKDAEGTKTYSIVGEDESDPAQGKLSWSSPLALALMGAKAGQEITWPGPDGENRLTVLSIT